MYDEAFKFLMTQIDRLENGLGLENPEATSSNINPQPSKWQSYYPCWAFTAHRTRTRYRNSGLGGNSAGGSGGGFRPFQPSPNHNEAKRWLRQAEAEYATLGVLRQNLHSDNRIACSLCFIAHQVVEKALKAAMYKLLGLNSQYLKIHSLECHAQAIHSEYRSANIDTSQLSFLALTMERHYLFTRYPNMYDIPDAPVDSYSQDEAKKAAEVAGEVLKVIRVIVE